MATNTLTFLCVFAALAFCAQLGESIQTNPREIVNKHNALRRGVRPTASNMLEMSWNHRVAINAQRWANTCSMRHSHLQSRVINNVKCGENLYMSSYPNTWSNAVQDWYDEVKDFRYGVGSINGGVVGHYTQVVWYRSNEVGCAVAHCPNSLYKYFYVCQYCPGGNIRGRTSRPYKAGPTCGDCPHACRNKLCTNPCPYIDKYSNCAALKAQVTCSHKVVASSCLAACKCTSEIQ